MPDDLGHICRIVMVRAMSLIPWRELDADARIHTDVREFVYIGDKENGIRVYEEH